MKYKVGDKVRVRTDLVVDKTYGGACFVKNMAHWRGHIVTISRIGDYFYKIEENSNPFDYNWTDEMLEDVSDDEEFHDAFIKMIDFAKEHLSKEQFNEFIYTIYTRGIENAPIIETPVYENIEYDGRVLWKRIKGIEYKIECNRMDTQEEMNIQEDIPEHDKKMADAFYEMVVKPLKEQLEKN